MTHIYKILSVLGSLREKLAAQTSKFRRFRDLIANISGTQQDIVKWKTNCVVNCDNRHTNFGLHMVKNYGRIFERAAISRLDTATHTS